MNVLEYRENSASVQDLLEHLVKASHLFNPPLTETVNLEAYSKKMHTSADTFECWDGDKIVGLMAGYLNDANSKEGYLTSLSVLREYNGRGIGAVLMTNLINKAKSLDYSTLTLEVHHDSAIVIKLHLSLGYQFSIYGESTSKMTKYLKNEQPMVSICCITYNQERYIRETLDGFLNQIVNFPIEIIIHDDASTDATRSIIEEYRKKHLDIIKPIYQQENQYSKGIDPFYEFVFPTAKGRYLAICEGDDYWTDPYKLQKQFDFLEQNSTYGLVHTDTNGYFQSKGKMITNLSARFKSFYEGDDKQELFFQLMNVQYQIKTPTVMLRKTLFEAVKPNERSFFMGDLPLWLDLSQMTKFKYLNSVTAVYRITPNTVTRQKSKLAAAQFELLKCELRIYYCHKYGYDVPQRLKDRYNKDYCFLLIADPMAKPFYEPFPQRKYYKSCGYLRSNLFYRYLFEFSHKIAFFCYKVWSKLLKMVGLKKYSI